MDKERAITTAINAAVEAFIAGDPEADDYFDMAEEFFHADADRFPDATPICD
ncbi:MAG: hypothetical protein OK454_01725 [Thaumarchaeota archaeon]|nr:hypothetical protein [Nitrososphaerota archaeon]